MFVITSLIICDTRHLTFVGPLMFFNRLLYTILIVKCFFEYVYVQYIQSQNHYFNIYIHVVMLHFEGKLTSSCQHGLNICPIFSYLQERFYGNENFAKKNIQQFHMNFVVKIVSFFF